MTQHPSPGTQAPIRHDLPLADNPHDFDPYEEEEDDGGSCSRYAWDLLRAQSQNRNSSTGSDSDRLQPAVFLPAYDRAWQKHVDSNGDGTLSFSEMQDFTADNRHSQAARQAIAFVEAYDRESARLRVPGDRDANFGSEVSS